MKNKIFLMLFIFSIFLCSCKHSIPITEEKYETPKTNIPDQIGFIQNVRKTVEDATSEIKNSATNIKSEVLSGKKDFPKASQWDSIDKKADNIAESSTVVDAKIKELNNVSAELTIAEKEKQKQEETIKNLQKNLDEDKSNILNLQNEIKEFQDGAKRRQQTIWMTVSGFSAIGLIVGIFLFIYSKSEIGIALSIASIIIACISYFMAAYALIVAIIGGIILILTILSLLYYLFIHKKALEETIFSFEEIKEKNFSDPSTKDKISKMQSDTTKKLVNELKITKRLK